MPIILTILKKGPDAKTGASRGCLILGQWFINVGIQAGINKVLVIRHIDHVGFLMILLLGYQQDVVDFQWTCEWDKVSVFHGIQVKRRSLAHHIVKEKVRKKTNNNRENQGFL